MEAQTEAEAPQPPFLALPTIIMYKSHPRLHRCHLTQAILNHIRFEFNGRPASEGLGTTFRELLFIGVLQPMVRCLQLVA